MTTPDFLDLQNRIAELGRILDAEQSRRQRWAEEEREAAEEDARQEAIELAAIERQEQIDADELADAQDAGDVDRFGRFIPYPRYP